MQKDANEDNTNDIEMKKQQCESQEEGTNESNDNSLELTEEEISCMNVMNEEGSDKTASEDKISIAEDDEEKNEKEIRNIENDFNS